MEHRYLGSTGMLVSAISYGNWITHGGQVEEKAAKACVEAALDCGITTFDTADVYAQGAAETVLGKALKGVRRDSIEIFTKVFWPTGPNPNNRGLSRKHILESCDASLKRLKTDHVDLLQAHRFDHHTPLEETLRAFDDLVRQGKVHYIGVSEWTAGQIDAAMAVAKEMGFDRLVSNQPQYSLIWRVIESEVVPASERHGMTQIVWSPLAQGVLTGKYAPGAEAPKGSRGAASTTDTGYIRRFLAPEVLEPVAAYTQICREAGLSPAEVALAWVLRNRNVSSAIIGASRPKQVRENARAVELKLDEDFVRRIEAVLAPTVVTDPAFTTSPAERP